MESIIRAIKRPISFNGAEVSDINAFISSISNGDTIHIQLKASESSCKVENPPNQNVVLTADNMRVNRKYLIKVRQYMTKPSSPEFDFQAKWNNDTPMPFRVMEGRVLKETRGMLMMECHAVPLKTDICMRCGRPRKHPVSRLYGIGPECGGHAHINPFETEEELYAALDTVKENLANIKWRGWIIKSAIEECEEVR